MRDKITAERLRQALERSGISGADLASELGVTRGLVSQWLNGHKDCPIKYLDSIATATRVDSGWLAAVPSPEVRLRTGDAVADAKWSFREAPPDGGRDYGSANIWTMPAAIPTLVREVGQNSLDHPAAPGSEIHIRFRLIELSPDSGPWREFSEASQVEALKEHIASAAQTKSRLATRLRSGLRRLETGERLLLLRIDDFGTTGLYGDEVTGDQRDPNPFAALIRNNLDSSKQSTTAGGSFGLGKATLWRCSDLSTVLFSSSLAPEHTPADKVGLQRTMGKAELTWHEKYGTWAGPGWFGKGETRPDSLWLEEEDLRKLQLSRDFPAGVDAARSSGTSILIVGFRDPASEEVPESSQILKRIAVAAAENFWPSIMRGKLRVSLERVVDDRLVDIVSEVDPIEIVPELCETLLKSDAGEVEEALEAPGDVVQEIIIHTIPRTKEDAADLIPYRDDLDAQARLIVRLPAEERNEDEYINTVALVRGREMVVKYWAKRNVVVGGRPFHAILLVGTAAARERPNEAAEQFIRLSEPPAHDKWEYNDEIREKYEWGAGRRLHDLFDRTIAALRKIVRPRTTEEDQGPRELKRLLQLSIPDPPEPAAGSLRNITKTFREGSWVIQADIHVRERQQVVRFRPRLIVAAESGSKPKLPWKELRVLSFSRGGKATASEDLVEVSPGTKRVTFHGISEPRTDGVPVAECRLTLDLQILRERKEAS